MRVWSKVHKTYVISAVEIVLIYPHLDQKWYCDKLREMGMGKYWRHSLYDIRLVPNSMIIFKNFCIIRVTNFISPTEVQRPGLTENEGKWYLHFLLFRTLLLIKYRIHRKLRYRILCLQFQSNSGAPDQCKCTTTICRLAVRSVER